LGLDLFFDPGVIGPLGALALLSLLPLWVERIRLKRHAAAAAAGQKSQSYWPK
jgi:hypothetical protein